MNILLANIVCGCKNGSAKCVYMSANYAIIFFQILQHCASDKGKMTAPVCNVPEYTTVV